MLVEPSPMLLFSLFRSSSTVEEGCFWQRRFESCLKVQRHVNINLTSQPKERIYLRLLATCPKAAKIRLTTKPYRQSPLSLRSSIFQNLFFQSSYFFQNLALTFLSSLPGLVGFLTPSVVDDSFPKSVIVMKE